MIPRIRSAIAALRRIMGVPDYAAYVEHTRTCHPGRAPLTEAEFVRERLDARYARPGSRCC